MEYFAGRSQLSRDVGLDLATRRVSTPRMPVIALGRIAPALVISPRKYAPASRVTVLRLRDGAGPNGTRRRSGSCGLSDRARQAAHAGDLLHRTARRCPDRLA